MMTRLSGYAFQRNTEAEAFDVVITGTIFVCDRMTNVFLVLVLLTICVTRVCHGI